MGYWDLPTALAGQLVVLYSFSFMDTVSVLLILTIVVCDNVVWLPLCLPSNPLNFKLISLTDLFLWCSFEERFQCLIFLLIFCLKCVPYLLLYIDLHVVILYIKQCILLLVDHSRVKLTLKTPPQDSDYINANFIKVWIIIFTVLKFGLRFYFRSVQL